MRGTDMDTSAQTKSFPPRGSDGTSGDLTSPPAVDLAPLLSRTAALWEQLRGKTLLLTGGTGFFGRWLLESFVTANRRFDLGARLLVLTRDSGRFCATAPGLAAEESLDLISGDVRTLEPADLHVQLGRHCPRQISHVIHAASETTVAANHDNPVGVLETACEGTRRVLDLAEVFGAERLLLTSSGAVYGTQPAGLEQVPETFTGAPDVSSPMSAYGEGKRVAELLCNARAQAGRLDCRIARCFAFVGPHLALDAHYAIGNFLRDALAGETIRVHGDGSPLRSYLYAADLATWLWTLLLHPDASGTYNVGSDEALTIAQVAEAVSRNSAAKPAVSIARQPDPSRPGARYVPDISRARRELGLDVWTPLDAAIRKTLEFHQLNSRKSL
jgi:nucleoside-diphosphate-sugar epimerase